MRYLILTAIILSVITPSTLHAEEVNAGFVQGLWYSDETVFASVPTRIYVALRNNTDHDLTGTIRFSIDGIRIGSSDVRALSGRLVEAWVDWTPTQGVHTVVANVSNAKLHIIGEETQEIDITGMIAKDTVFVDLDTDGDGIGNEEDTDDDNDGVSDEDELSRGSNPLTLNPELANESEDSTEEESESISIVILPDPEQGLERFMSDGTVDDVFSSVTEKIEKTKKSLDEYRKNRTGKNKKETEEVETPALSSVPISETDTATITRSRIEPNISLLERFINFVSSILSTGWTLILAIFSFLLGFPALLELVLLWVILIIIYRTARRYGRRRRI